MTAWSALTVTRERSVGVVEHYELPPARHFTSKVTASAAGAGRRTPPGVTSDDLTAPRQGVRLTMGAMAGEPDGRHERVKARAPEV